MRILSGLKKIRAINASVLVYVNKVDGHFVSQSFRQIVCTAVRPYQVVTRELSMFRTTGNLITGVLSVRQFAITPWAALIIKAIADVTYVFERLNGSCTLY